MVTILPTIDVEGVHGSDPFKQMVLGEIGEAETWGVYRLANIFKQWGVSATFFVDCFEHVLWGKDPIEKVCVDLVELGQDVQLHTHPSWRDDKNDFQTLRDLKRKKHFLPQDKDFMAKLSKDEQVQVLQHGSDLLESWIGKKPIAHRSGGYSINQDTIAALSTVGIPVDSSMNRGHTNSQLTWSCNQVVERDGVIEVPVTCFRRLWMKKRIGIRLPAESKYFKTSLDGVTLEELLWYVEETRRLNLKVVNLFMHSYSLLKLGRRFLTFAPEFEDDSKLRGFLEKTSSDPNTRFMNMTQFLERFQTHPEEFTGPDGVPEIVAPYNLLSRSLSKVKRMGLSLVGSPIAERRLNGEISPE